jgi:hypothetical protein
MKMDAMKLKRAALAAGLAAVVALGAGCKKQAAPNTVFPATNEVSGWTKVGETRTFAGDDLSNYIDGGADKYLKAGFRSVATSDYKFADSKSNDQTQVTADVYTMATAEGAKTIFESDPAGDAKSAPVGEVARLYAQSLVFRKGPYVVQIVAYQTSPQLQPAMVALGQGIEKKLAR